MLQKRIIKVKVAIDFDANPDLSHLGKWERSLSKARQSAVYIDRASGELRGKNDNVILTWKDGGASFDPHRECEYFVPTNYDKDYPQHALQDWQRMEGYERGEWHMTYVQAIAEIGIECGHTSKGICWNTQRLHSPSLHGIESDSDTTYFKEVAEDELDYLKDVLLTFGFPEDEVNGAIKGADLSDITG